MNIFLGRFSRFCYSHGMKLGIDQLQKLLSKLRKKQVGVLCHAASVNSKQEHLLSLLLKQSEIKIKKLFAPEHGVWAVAQDMESVHDQKEPLTGLSVTSLYGSSFDTLRPSVESLKNLDAVICDLQDIGSRYYTFVYTIAFMMQACREANIPVFILDRPNPINGNSIEGGLVEPGFESFVGLYPIPNRHGMTVGELALLFNEAFEINADLTIVKMEKWNRQGYYESSGLPFIIPSPNMPTVETALVYPGTCLIEATELSEGRGTTKPLEMIGAPYIQPLELIKKLESFKLKGLRFRPLYFRPMFQKHAGEICGGIQLHVVERSQFKPYLTGLAVIKAIHDLYPKKFQWRAKPYEFVKEIPAIDLLTGSASFRNYLKQGKPWKEIVQNYESYGKKEFIKMRKEYLLYEPYA